MALVFFAAGCSDSSGPVRYPPPPPPGPTPPPSATTPPPAAPAPAAPEAGQVALGAAMLVGGNAMSNDALDRSTEDFRAVFSANLGAFRRCYAAASQRAPALAGAVKVKVVIRGDGGIHELKHLGGSIADPELVDCTVRALGTLPYRPHSGQLFAVETPIEYAP
jgi:hypothetical protein